MLSPITLLLSMSQVVLGDSVIVAVSRVTQSNHSNCACWLRSWRWWAVVWRGKTEILKLNNKVENRTKKNHKISLKPDDGYSDVKRAHFVFNVHSQNSTSWRFSSFSFLLRFPKRKTCLKNQNLKFKSMVESVFFFIITESFQGSSHMCLKLIYQLTAE